MAYIPGYEYDIFISYRHVDNDKGWVSQFCESLSAKSKAMPEMNELEIWIDNQGLRGNTLFDDEIKSCIEQSALFLVIHSKNYPKSEYCRQELDWFLDYNNNQMSAANQSRLFNVLIHNIHHEEWMEELSGTAGFKFYDTESEDGYSYPLKPECQVFDEKVEELLLDALETLKLIKNGVLPSKNLQQVNYNLAKVLEGKAKSEWDKAKNLKKDKSTDNPDYGKSLRHALLYALEAQRKPIPEGKVSIPSAACDCLSWIEPCWMLPERKKMPAPNLRTAFYAIALSPDGKVIASGSHDNTIQLWDAQSGEVLNTLQGHKGWVLSIAYSPDGSKIASGSWDRTVRLWDVNSGVELFTLEGHKGEVSSVAYRPDGRVIASGASDKTVRLWDAQNGVELVPSKDQNCEVLSVAYSPNGKVIASGSWDKMVRLWDVDSGEVKILEGHESAITVVAYSPDGKVIASGSWDKTVRLWDVDSCEVKTLECHEAAVNAVAYSPDGKMIASGASDKTVRLWDTQSGKVLRVLKGHEGAVNAVAYRSDGLSLFSGSDDRSVRLWDVRDGTELQTPQGGYGYTVHTVAYSPDGKRIASGSWDKTVRLWDAQSGEVWKTLQGHTGQILSVAYSPDGERIASGSSDKTVRLWDAQSGEVWKTLQGHTGQILSVAYSPDGKRIASSSSDNTIRQWNEQSGKMLGVLHCHGVVNTLTYSPDGEVIASGWSDGAVRLFSTKSGEILKTLKGHGYAVNTLAYSPDGEVIASGCSDGAIKLWDAHRGEILNVLQGHEHDVLSLAYSPDGKVIVSGSSDFTIRLWDAQSFVKRLINRHDHGIHMTLPSQYDWSSTSSTPSQTIQPHDAQSEVPRIRESHDKYLPINSSDANSDPTVRLLDKEKLGRKLSTESRGGVDKNNDHSEDDIQWDKELNHLTNRLTGSMTRFLDEFSPAEVADALEFLWNLKLDGLKLVANYPTPALLPQEGGYYITWNDHTRKFIPLLEAPRPDETKMDQLVRWLEERNAYHKTPVGEPAK